MRLAPYQAAVLVTGQSLSAAPAGLTPSNLTAARFADDHPIEEGWTVRFLDATPGEERSQSEDASAPVELPHLWESERSGYAGRAQYDLVFDSGDLWQGGIPAHVVLDLGRGAPEAAAEDGEVGIRGSSYRALFRPPVGEVVAVEVNGEPFGVLYAPPYEVDITRALVVGRNAIRIVVANATASAFADPRVRGAVDEMVGLSRELYGQRFRMQDLDAATEGIRSGLLEVPRLRWG